MDKEKKALDIIDKVTHSLIGDNMDIEPCDGCSWNGWIVHRNGFREFVENLWYDYVKRIVEALEKEGLTDTKVYREWKEELDSINSEYEKVNK